MKIAFVYPSHESIGIEYLSAVLKQRNHETKLFIDPLLFNSYLIRVPFLNSLTDFKKNLIRDIIDYNPDVICFSVVSDYFPWACDIAESLKKVINIPIVFGGVHPTSVPDKVINKEFIDFVIVGEGEDALLELVDSIGSGFTKKNIKNVWMKCSGKIITNPVRPLISNLDSLPFPDKELYFNLYKGFVNEVYTIMCTRGCIYSCVYCYNNHMKDLYNNDLRYFRWRSPENIITELKDAKNKYNIKRITFYDDMFIFEKRWLMELCETYKREVKLPFTCIVHPNMLDKETIHLLEGAGCGAMIMGFQTLNENLRKDVLNREDSNERIISNIKIISKTNIYLYSNIIFGLPKQDEEELLNIVYFFNKNKVDFPSVFWLRYYPRTQLARYLSSEIIDKVENGEMCSPYSMKGLTFNNRDAKIANLLLLSQFLPFFMLDFLIKYKIYKLLPSYNFHRLGYTIIAIFKKLFTRKKYPFCHFTVYSYIRYYSFFLLRLFRLRICKTISR